MKRVLGVLAFGCLLAACGSTSHPATQAQTVTAPVVNRHVCNTKDYAMGCALPPVTVPDIQRGANANTTTTVLQGVDFGWSCPVSSARNFGASYLSLDSSKDWTRSCVDAFHKAGKATVAVWETSATRTLDGYSAGQSDARAAAAQLRALGAPANAHVDFAIDYDETPSQASAVASYFRGADSVLGVDRVGAYGGYYPVTRLCAAHLTSRSWATYAWSGGQWPPASCAPLEQYLNSTSVDYDRAIAPDYGQWPSPVPPKPSGPKCFGKGWQHTALCNKVRQQDAVLGRKRNLELAYAKVSEHNLSVIEARLAVEKRKATAYNAQLVKSLAQYGFHK